MPELPEIEAYLHALSQRVVGAAVLGLRVRGTSVLKTYDPPLDAVTGRRVEALRRLGKRIVFVLDEGLYLVVHLMVAGRLHWAAPDAPVPRKLVLAAVDFDTGTLILTEAGTKRRAGIWLVRGDDGLSSLDPGGIEVMGATPAAFRAALLRERHTLKRALTDPRFVSGIGGAFADEILHRAHLSPLQLNTNLDDGELDRLHDAARGVLEEWRARRIEEAGEGFPEGVSAFHPEMAVHGKHGQPCPVCGAPVQRIVYAERETNYCPQCQTGGRILADRSLSRLLKDAYPRSLDDLDA